MYAGLAALLAASVVTADLGSDEQRVVEAVKQHFAGIHSIRVSGVERALDGGGLFADDPVKSPPVYNKTKDKVNSDYDVWLSPPKYRSFWKELSPATEGVRHSSRVYFAGNHYTFLE